MKTSCLFFVLLVLFSVTVELSAQIPRTLTYQGVLTDTLGNPRPDGSYSITFRLYQSSTGGSPSWTEAKTLQVTRGLFYTVLGDQVSIPDTVRFDKQYWLGVQVEAEPELSPRIPLTSVGSSFSSLRADTAQHALSAPLQTVVDSARIAGTIPDNVVTSSKIANNAVTMPKINQSGAIPGQVIKWTGTVWAPANDSVGSGGGLTLPFAGTVSSSGTAFSITNTGTGEAMEAITNGSIALRAQAPGTGVAVLGLGTVVGSTGSSVDGIAGVRGEATNSSGQTYGVLGTNASVSLGAAGVRGEAVGLTGQIYGMHGTSASSTLGSAGVKGEALTTSGVVHGVVGITNSTSTDASGVHGVAQASSGATNGVWGQTNSITNGAAGVLGEANGASGITSGVKGITASTTDFSSGVRGITIGGSGLIYGVSGLTNSPTDNAAGVYGEGHSTGKTYGVHGVTTSTSAFTAGVKGEALAASGSTVGVDGETNSSTNGAVGTRGVALANSGLVEGVHGGTFSTTTGARGVHGVAEANTGEVHGVFGETNSSTNNLIDNASGVKGVANAIEGRVYGVHGKSASSSGGTAGVRGDVAAPAPTGVNIPPTIGVWGFTGAQSRTEGVRGDAYFFGEPAHALDGTRIGVRGYAGAYGTETTKRVGVEGDAHHAVTQPFTSSGVRGFIRGSISALGYSGVVGQALLIGGEGPDPDVSTVGHVGVWGITQSDVLASAGVIGDATVTSGSTVYGAWGRSKSTSDLSAAVRAEGNGVNAPGSPKAAALELRNGAVRVSGASRAAKTITVTSPSWTSTPSCWALVNTGYQHLHYVGHFFSVNESNDLITSNSIIIATVETPTTPMLTSLWVQVFDKQAGSCTFRVAAVGAWDPGNCDPLPGVVRIHYFVINPFPEGQ